MAALVAGIHDLITDWPKDVDGRDKPGHDVREFYAGSRCGISGRSP
jgi:hypothetical protein